MGLHAAASHAMATSDTGMHKGQHGSFGGHVLPGSMFIAMGLWWMFSTLHTLPLGRGKRKPARFRGWCTFPYAPWFPLEPVLKIALPLYGISGEVYFSHDRWRSLYLADGHFWGGHLNNWQHSAMYLSFIISGAVDLLGIKVPLPNGTEQVFLAMAFAVEGTLLAFHIKGSALDREVHLLLTVIVALCAAVILLEAAFPSSVLLSMGRSWAAILQGTWWCQAGRVLFLGNPAWDEADMAAAMYLPVVFALHIMFVAVALLAVYTVVQVRLRPCLRGGGGDARYVEMEGGLSRQPSDASRREVPHASCL